MFQQYLILEKGNLIIFLLVSIVAVLISKQQSSKARVSNFDEESNMISSRFDLYFLVTAKLLNDQYLRLLSFHLLKLLQKHRELDYEKTKKSNVYEQIEYENKRQFELIQDLIFQVVIIFSTLVIGDILLRYIVF